MSMDNGKLDKALDDIVMSNNPSGGRGRRGGRQNRGNRGNRRGGDAPVGGVAKPQRNNRRGQAQSGQNNQGAPAKSKEGKIMITQLPKDIEQSQLQDYFIAHNNIGKPKKTFMHYGPNQNFSGAATIIFHKQEQAAEAVEALRSVKLDGRNIMVELIVSPDAAPVVQPTPIAERITNTAKKAHPKPASDKKPARGGGRGRGRGRARGNARESRKTIEELDAEMEDWVTENNVGGDSGMVTNGNSEAAGGNQDEEMI
ncbi:hypothetical protein EJ04DRAFT_548764 [Polyplosphaeria fusca]|uniref:RRM domain-containing protein n=1 Tax=Polyplosphaeria fusca TaxID=682080 RepID=A0A9P4RB84_9PLEO|nr:hypothetical protein EJ04DRAFT_548764 [Polyplosphaeria fusca]